LPVGAVAEVAKLSEIAFKSVVPILFVRDVSASAAFFREKLGCAIDFLSQTPTAQPWGGTDLPVRDPDGNVISCATYG